VHAATFENVNKIYKSGLFRRRGLTAVDNVSLTIPHGSVFGLLGPNRAGKTTLVKLLLNLARPSRGAVTRLGEAATVRASLNRVGYMHENHAFPKYLSASEVLHFCGGLSGIPTDQVAGKSAYWLERVGLADRAHEPISRFSKGMVQRLGLAQAMLNDPEFLILDEPTEGLDLLGRQLLRDIVQELKAASKTVLLVSHVLPEVQELCTELAVIVAGRVAYRGKLTELTSNRTGLEAALKAIYVKGTA